MPICFLCLDEKEPQFMRQVCASCVESAICQACEANALQLQIPDLLTHCPICRAQVVSPPAPVYAPLISVWHPFTLLVWNLLNLDCPITVQMMYLLASHSVLAALCRRTNRARDQGRIFMLRKRFSGAATVIHAPYHLTLLLEHLLYGTFPSTPYAFLLYSFGHVVFPILCAVVAHMLLELMLMPRNRYTVGCVLLFFFSFGITIWNASTS